jgi:hypothetical protein
MFTGFTVFSGFVFLKTSESAFLWVPAVPWFLFGVFIVCFGMKYRVLWDKKSVIMRVSGGPERRIRFDEITSVKNEVSSAGDVLAQSRPFFRIAVYRNRDPNGFVDISLRHFYLADIQELLVAIRKSRPDLDVPSIATNDTSRVRKFRF